MITYKILKVIPATSTIQVRYSKENYNDYHTQFVYDTAPDGSIDEETIHNLVKLHVEEAIFYWDQIASAPEDIELSSDTGLIKDTIIEEAPLYDPMTHELQTSVTETETTKTISYEVVALPEGVIAENARRQRNDLLSMTDALALVDRNITDEMLAYRQALRDITDQEGFPMNIVWPIAPID